MINNMAILPIPPNTHIYLTHIPVFIIYSIISNMSFGIDNRKLKKLIDLYRPHNHAEEMKYLVVLKGEEDLFISISFLIIDL